MRLTVFEQSSLQIRPTGAQEEGCLTHPQATALQDLSDRMGAGLVSWQGPTTLRLRQFVGAIRVGDLQLEILPKLDGLTGPAQIRQNLLAMMAVTQDLKLRTSDVVRFLESTEPFIAAIARLYCHHLLEAVRRGLRQEYVLHEDLLPCIRGKVDWASQAKRQTTQHLEFACAFDERSEDTALNRTLKAALVRARAVLEEGRPAKVVAELRYAMEGISDTCPPMERVARLQTDRANRRLEPLLALAKLILGNRNPDLGRSVRGDRNTYAMVWDMNVLFEEYVGRVAEGTLRPQGLRVDLQHGGAYLARDILEKRKAFLLRPDILVWLARTPTAVGDTKWKRLARAEINLGVSESDVYQLLAYAHRFKTNVAVLLYPHHPALGLPGIQREFEIDRPDGQAIRVRVVTVDLATLDSVPRQLEQAFLADSLTPDTLQVPAAS